MASGTIKSETKDGNCKNMIVSDQHTDSLFKDLENLEVPPSEKVWINIESRLDKKKKRLIPLFWIWGAAASLLLLGGLFLLFPDDLMNDQNYSVASRKSQDQEVVGSAEKFTLNEKEQHETPIQSLPKNVETVPNGFIASEKTDVQKYNSADRSGLSAISEKENRVIFGTSEEESDGDSQKIDPLSEVRLSYVPVNPGVARQQKQPKKQGYPRFSLPAEDKSEKPNVGITLGGEYSPTYAYRDVSGTSATGMDESGLMTSGGGFSLAVKMNSRWQVETGVKFAMLGQEVKPESSGRNVYAALGFSAESSVSLKEVPLTNSMGAIDRDAPPAVSSDVPDFQDSYNAVVEMKSTAPAYEESTVLEQNLSYLQVPFTLRYQLVQQGPVHLSLAGGIGANWLIDNNAYLEMSGQRQRIGQTGGISDLSFSTHAGLAVSVPLYRGLGIKMEPRINYFLSDISENAPGKYRPYSVGVFTGLFYQW
jgi:hypothetical protein